MKNLFVLLLLVSCAHQLPPKEVHPSWVTGIRSGEEALKVTQGSKVFYRRIAGSPQMARQASCDLAVMRVEDDIRKEYPLAKVPFNVDVVYYDKEHADCAVTGSVDASFAARQAEMRSQLASEEQRVRDLASQDQVTEDDAAQILIQRGEIASRFALTGLTKEDFEKFTKNRVSFVTGEGPCSRYLHSESFSIHGTTQVCWKNEHIAGYCTAKDGICWTKQP